MKQASTDREILGKGVKRLLLALPFFILGPTLIFIGAGSEHPIIFLMPGIAFAILAVYFMFSGINTILDSMFKTKKTR
ncbi:DUF6095 family protein [Nonlabens ponticola]|uniref:Uncharacterized protein n=1 Tax=Nonlabens ponticola TaxID=2496866 RepID=A0A3S9MZT6_9FLAO|nr:DUF6095 family protein [Nonlabens ponticola]AZQ44677.1 hypothetical protein EJ995_10650 [Nonlabens ponticola]